MRAIAAGLCLVSAFGLTACSRTLDADALEEDITSMYDLASASCPDDIEPKAGESFNCTATDAGGEQVEVRVDQLNDDGNVDLFLVGEEGE